MSKAKGKDHKGFRRATLVTASLAAVMACGPQGREEDAAGLGRAAAQDVRTGRASPVRGVEAGERSWRM